MRITEYRTYLEEQDLPEEAIEERLTLVKDFTDFFTDLGLEEGSTEAAKEAVDRYARKLIDEGRNALVNFLHLRDYAGWLDHRPLYVAWIEILDCYNALSVLADAIEGSHGRGMRKCIFNSSMPPLGANEMERCAYTQALTERIAQAITPEEARQAWFQVQHGIPIKAWRRGDEADREKFLQCGDIDAFLDLKRQERNALLTHLRDEGELWYTVEITDEVLDFVKSDPEMEGGRREGDKVYITKIPYNAVRYLHESDPRMKRYYACHCPMLREAICREEPISPEVCYCSLGHASHYLAGLGQELKGEVLESAVRGDMRCRFVFHLPGANSSDKE